MPLSDLLSLPLAALWQQKSRTVMTTLGVIFGTFVLTASLSIGQGVQDLIERESHRSDFLRRINVSPKYVSAEPEQTAEKTVVTGTMSDVKRGRIGQAIARNRSQRQGGKPHIKLTRDKLKELAALPHVQEVVPSIYWLSGYAVLNQKSESTDIQVASANDDFVQKRIVAGRSLQRSNERGLLVSEYLLYKLGVADDSAIEAVLGKKLRIEVRFVPWKAGFEIYIKKPEGSEPMSLDEEAAVDKIRQRLPMTLDKLGLTPQVRLLEKSLKGQRQMPTVISEDFAITGVIREPTTEEQQSPWEFRRDADVVLPAEEALDFIERFPNIAERGIKSALVLVDHERNTKTVYEQIKSLGWDVRAPLEFVEQQRMQWLLVFAGMTCVAAVALFVAALGIANTMLMSVLERTREIGTMKALGASDGVLQSIFLFEGGLIGLVGGGLGLLLAWGASFPGDAWVRSLASKSAIVEIKESLFVFPGWIILTVLAFALVVTTLAAVYPARRAAKIDPVAALRHE